MIRRQPKTTRHYTPLPYPPLFRSSLPGVFAAGDATTVPYKQIVIAMGAGSTAALSAFDHLIRSPLVVTEDRKEAVAARSEEHTSELQSLMRISYAVSCLKKKNKYLYDII